MTLGGLRTWVHGSGQELQGQIEIMVPGKSTGPQVLEQSPDLPLIGYRSLGKSLGLSFLSYKVGDNNTIPSYTTGLPWGLHHN